MSLETFAEVAGMSQADLAEIEAGRAMGGLAALWSLAKALGVAIDDIVPDSA